MDPNPQGEALAKPLCKSNRYGPVTNSTLPHPIRQINSQFLFFVHLGATRVFKQSGRICVSVDERSFAAALRSLARRPSRPAFETRPSTQTLITRYRFAETSALEKTSVIYCAGVGNDQMGRSAGAELALPSPKLIKRRLDLSFAKSGPLSLIHVC